MKLFEAYYLLLFFSLRVASKELGRHAKPRCIETCGNNVTIPYPFGIGAECAVNEWYVVECSSSKPYLHALNYRFEIVSVSFRKQTITVIDKSPYVLSNSDCQNPKNKNFTQRYTIDSDKSPFWLSAPDNIFMFEGCGNAVMMDHGSSVVTGCSTSCLNSDSTLYSYRNKNCVFGINCCQTPIPRYLKSYNISFSMDLGKQGRYNVCASAFVMETNSYTKRRFSNSQSSIASWKDAFVPISFLWTLSEDDHHRVTCSCGFGRAKLRVDLGNGTSINTWKCRSTSSFTGNPYLKDGCHTERTEIQYMNDVCSKSCGGKGLYCDDSDTIYNINGSVYKEAHHCYKPRKPLFGVILDTPSEGADLESKRGGSHPFWGSLFNQLYGGRRGGSGEQKWRKSPLLTFEVLLHLYVNQNYWRSGANNCFLPFHRLNAQMGNIA